MKKYLMALDQGTTSSRAIIFNEELQIESVAQYEFTQYFPCPLWVEHDPMEILNTQVKAAKEVIEKAGISADEIAAIGITNQRETTVVWDKTTGKPVYNAIVWQDRRTSEYCNSLITEGCKEDIYNKTGLYIDPYYSATKIKWILDNVAGAKEKAKSGDLLFGTIDTWLLYNLTSGKVHATDYSNASRTMLYNIHELKWDEELLELFDIPKSMLPKVCDSSYHFGDTDKSIIGTSLPITGIAGDQQSSLFAHGAVNPGDIKNTYGTGCFLLMNTGDEIIKSKANLISTIAFGINGKVSYALEGSVFVGGAVVQWLRDELQIISSASETEKIALSVEDTNDAYIVPSFTGLGAPYWKSDAKGIITGLTRGVSKAHIVRAALESIAYQSYDLIAAMQKDMGIINNIEVDGGATANNFLMQFQADIIGKSIIRPECLESTAFGAASLAGLNIEMFDNIDEIMKYRKTDRIFKPNMSEEERMKKLKGWSEAVKTIL